MKKTLTSIFIVWLTQMAYAGHDPSVGEYSFSMSGAGIRPAIRDAEIAKSGETYILRIELFDGVWSESELLLSPSSPVNPELKWMDFSAALRVHRNGYVYVLVLIGTVTENKSELRGKVARVTEGYGEQILHGKFILKLNKNSEEVGADQPATASEPKPDGSEKPNRDSEVRPQ